MTEKQAKAIKYLDRIPEILSRYEYKEFCIDFNSFFNSLPIQANSKITQIVNLFEGHPRDYSIIYRARENEKLIPEISSIKLPFKKIEDVSINEKAKQSITFGRCNKKNVPRFYASSDWSTACLESITKGFTERVNESKELTVGCWKIIEPLNLAKINYCEQSIKQILTIDNPFYSRVLELAQKENNEQISYNVRNGYGDEFYTRKVLEFFYREFAKMNIKDEFDYYPTNLFCEHVFDCTEMLDINSRIDGVLYPSTAYSYQNKNIVLHPRAMKKIKFIDAMMVQTVKFSETGNVNFTPLEQHVKANENGIIQWQNFNW
jgi:hypothetical protein